MSRFQVIIAALNGAATLPYTLQTLADQPGDDISFLLSDNSSTDGTRQIMLDFAARDPRFQVVHTEQILQLKDSWEFAISHATGDFLMFTGADDGLYPGCLDVAKEALRLHPHAQAIAHRSSLSFSCDVPEHCALPGYPPGMMRMSAVNVFELRKASEDLRKQALSLIHSPLPVPYQGWISKEIVAGIRKRVGRVFAHHVTDFWFAAATGAELQDAEYVLSGLPLTLPVYSFNSSAMSLFGNTGSPVGDLKLSLETSTEGENLIFLTRSARGFRYEALKLILKHWSDAPYTKEELDLNYLCGFWEEWRHRSSLQEGPLHATAGSLPAFRAYIENLATETGLSALLADLDGRYVLGGDNSDLWKKWGTSFQQDCDWSHDVCIDTRLLGCRNVHDVSKVAAAIVQVVLQSGDAYAKILSGRKLSGGPRAYPVPDLASSGIVAVRQAHEDLLRKALQGLKKDHATMGRKLRKLDKHWHVDDDAPWALRTGMKLARFLGRATGSLPK